MAFFDYISFGVAFSVLIRTLVIFLFAFLVLRLLGKRHLAHFTYLDLLLVIALGSAVGDVMIYDESVTQIFSSMIAIAVVGVFVKILQEASSRSKRVSSFTTGTARLVIKNGEVIERALAQEDMSKDDLIALLRVKGFDSVKAVRRAFLEADGEISVIGYNNKNKN